MMQATLPTASNAISLNMEQQVGSCGQATVAPHWSYASPTPDMEAKGLTPSKLREILQQINNDSDNTMAQNFNPNLPKVRFIPFVLILIGMIICTTSMGSTGGSGTFLVGMALFGIGGFGTVGSFWFVNSRHMQAVQMCVDQLRQYVEGELNEQWQKAHGIRWSIGTTQILQTDGTSRNRGIAARTLHHIQITSVAPAMAQQVPMQHMVQMPLMQGMQGVPVNVQGQQMMLVPAGTQIPMQQAPVQYVVAGSQGAPPQYQQEAPPQYEAGGTVTTDAEGVHAVYN